MNPYLFDPMQRHNLVPLWRSGHHPAVSETRRPRFSLLATRVGEAWQALRRHALPLPAPSHAPGLQFRTSAERIPAVQMCCAPPCCI